LIDDVKRFADYVTRWTMLGDITSGLSEVKGYIKDNPRLREIAYKIELFDDFVSDLIAYLNRDKWYFSVRLEGKSGDKCTVKVVGRRVSRVVDTCNVDEALRRFFEDGSVGEELVKEIGSTLRDVSAGMKLYMDLIGRLDDVERKVAELRRMLG
jgi:uncharacterized protein YutD